eukprot:GEZU01039258.1.p1 GENE.GEZU01039258.1~~GEZU01039258.1.p1  ORF type:complete len:228 (+),score=66.05 GEZU01039258.1:117-800(+)
MVKIVSLLILHRFGGIKSANTTDANNNNSPSSAVILAGAIDTSSWYYYFYNKQVQEFCTFASREIASRVTVGRQQFVYEGHCCYVHAQSDGLVAIAITDRDYPSLVAFNMLRKALHAFTEYAQGQISGGIKGLSPQKYFKDYCLQCNAIVEMMKRYQNPSEADNIEKIKKEIDETKLILNQALERLIERGEKLDDLVAKSQDLSEASRAFYTSAKKMNRRCPYCTIL